MPVNYRYLLRSATAALYMLGLEFFLGFFCLIFQNILRQILNKWALFSGLITVFPS